jgi:hypothetical protein
VLVVAAIGNNVGDQRTQADDLAAEIDERGEEGDVVAICPDQLGPSLERAVAARGLDVDLVPYPAEGDPRFVDWRDYEERNDAVDPVEWARDLLEEAGDRPVWLVWKSGYRTFEGDCELVAYVLETTRGVVSEETLDGAFETATLSQYR